MHPTHIFTVHSTQTLPINHSKQLCFTMPRNLKSVAPSAENVLGRMSERVLFFFFIDRVCVNVSRARSMENAEVLTRLCVTLHRLRTRVSYPNELDDYQFFLKT